MEKHRSHDLLRGVKGPHLDWPLRSLAPALVDQREQRKAAERALHEDCEGTKELAFACVFGTVWWCGN